MLHLVILIKQAVLFILLNAQNGLNFALKFIKSQCMVLVDSAFNKIHTSSHFQLFSKKKIILAINFFSKRLRKGFEISPCLFLGNFATVHHEIRSSMEKISIQMFKFFQVCRVHWNSFCKRLSYMVWKVEWMIGSLYIIRGKIFKKNDFCTCISLYIFLWS